MLQSEKESRRWSREYRSRVIQGDLADLENVRDVNIIENLVIRLPELVGSPLSLNALREGLQVSHQSVSRWMKIPENLYMIFRIYPFGAHRIRAVKKEAKHYHLDWTIISDPGARFENLVAFHLLKWVFFSQDCLLGHNFIQVEWYVTVRKFISGLMKNAFAFYHYKMVNVLFGVLLVMIINILPLLAFFFTSGITRGLFGASVMVRILSFANGFSNTGIDPWYSVWGLVTPYIYIYITLKAAINTTIKKGIVWRGTYYSLDELRANRQKISI